MPKMALPLIIFTNMSFFLDKTLKSAKIIWEVGVGSINSA